MPRIRREGIPEPLMAHLIRRVRQREISTSQLGLLARWLATDPEVPKGRWFNRFPEMIVCGEGGTCEDVLTARTGSSGRRGDVIAIKSATRESFRSRQVAAATAPQKVSAVADCRYNLRLTQPPLQLMERDRHFGNIRVTEQIGRIACGWLDCCVLSRLGIIAIRQNQPRTSHYECSC